MTTTEISPKESARRLSCKAFTVTTYTGHGSDGFSLVVATELEAYKAAHHWQGAKWTRISKTQNGTGWIVQVYTNAIP